MSARGEGSDVLVDREHVYDTRSARMSVQGAPDLFTPAGKRPITPTAVDLSFDIPTGDVRSIRVYGRGAPNRRNYRNRDGRLWRRVQEADAPPWLKELIEEYRP